MVGGLIMWKNASLSDRGGFATTQLERLTAQQIYGEARQLFLESNWQRSGIKAKVALSLEAARPDPALRYDLQRMLAIASMRSGDYPEAAKYWKLVAHSSGSAEDLKNFRECQVAAQKSQLQEALAQLKQAQDLAGQGQTQRALAEATQATRALEKMGCDSGTLQVAHLVVADAALRHGNSDLARQRMGQARQLGPLRREQEAVYRQLQPKATEQVAAQVQPEAVPVVVPSLGEAQAYPKRNGSSVPKAVKPPVGRPAALSPGMGMDTQSPQSQPASRPEQPKVELPRLQLPEGNDKLPGYQGQRGDGRLPSYQDQSGNSLPTYNNKTRDRDRLPGY